VRLTPELKRVVVRQFLTGDPIQYLARLYNVPPERIEEVIRRAMIQSEEEGYIVGDGAGPRTRMRRLEQAR